MLFTGTTNPWRIALALLIGQALSARSPRRRSRVPDSRAHRRDAVPRSTSTVSWTSGRI